MVVFWHCNFHRDPLQILVCVRDSLSLPFLSACLCVCVCGGLAIMYHRYSKAKEMVGGSVRLAQDKASQIAAIGLSKGLDAVDIVYDATMAVGV